MYCLLTSARTGGPGMQVQLLTQHHHFEFPIPLARFTLDALPVPTHTSLLQLS
mgnify:CR=1 FL=1